MRLVLTCGSPRQIRAAPVGRGPVPRPLRCGANFHNWVLSRIEGRRGTRIGRAARREGLSRPVVGKRSARRGNGRRIALVNARERGNRGRHAALVEDCERGRSFPLRILRTAARGTDGVPLCCCRRATRLAFGRGPAVRAGIAPALPRQGQQLRHNGQDDQRGTSGHCSSQSFRDKLYPINTQPKRIDFPQGAEIGAYVARTTLHLARGQLCVPEWPPPCATRGRELTIIMLP